MLAGYEQYFRSYLTTRKADGDFDPSEESSIRERYPAALEKPDQSALASLPQELRYRLAHLFNKGSDFRFGLGPEGKRLLAKSREPQSDAPARLRDALREDFLYRPSSDPASLRRPEFDGPFA